MNFSNDKAIYVQIAKVCPVQLLPKPGKSSEDFGGGGDEIEPGIRRLQVVQQQV